MAENPIRASDLFEDDGVIKELIAQLQSMEKYLQNIGKAFAQTGQDIQKSTKAANVTQREGQKVLQENAKHAKQLEKAQQDLAKAKSTVNGEIEKLKIAAKEQNQLSKAQIKAEHEKTAESQRTREELIKLKTETQEQTRLAREQAKADIAKTKEGQKARMELAQYKEEQRLANIEAQAAAKVNMYAEGSYNQLAARYQLIKKELNEMSREQRYNTQEGRDMERQAKAIYNEMTRMQSATGANQMKVGSYAQAIREANMSMKEMQDELKILKEISFEGMGQDEIRDVEQAIGELTDRMQKYKYEVEAHGMDTFEMISGSARGAAASVQLVAGSFNLLGVESKHLQTVQQNIYSMMAVTTALQQLEQVYHRGHMRVLATKVRGIGVWVKETAVKKYNAAQTWLNVRAQRAQTAASAQTATAAAGAATAKTAATAATISWTAAIRAFSRAVYNIPVLGWLLAIIGAIIALVVALVRHWDRVVGMFRSLGQWMGIVKETSEETETYQDRVDRLTKSVEKLDKTYKRLERTQKVQLTLMQRQLEIMQARGVGVDKIRAKEEQMLRFEIQAANERLKIAEKRLHEQELLTLAKITNLDLEKEEREEARRALEEQRQAYQAIKDEIGGLEHDLTIFHINEKNRIQERNKELRKETEERLQNERKAALELDVLRAKQRRDEAQGFEEQQQAALAYTEARKKQAEEMAEIEMRNMSGAELELAREKHRQNLQQIDDEYYSWLFEEEQKRFDLLNDLTQDQHAKERAELGELYRERMELAGDDVELRLAVEKWYHAELKKLQEKQVDREREAAQKRADAAMDQFEEQQALAESQFEVEARTDAQRQRFRLEQDLEWYQKRLELQAKYGNVMTETEVEITRNMIKRVQRELDEIGRTDFNFWDHIGITLTDQQREGMQMAAGYTLGLIQSVIDGRAEQAQAAVDAAQAEIDAAQSAYEQSKSFLEQERQNRDDGYAHRVALAEKEYEQEKKNLERKERQKEEALKLAEKERHRQARLEGLAQAGNLLVASTKIMAQFGFPFAIPIIALMWSTFAQQRRRVRSEATEMYGRGHFETIGGGSHASGNDTPLNIDSKDRRVERGEAFAVFNKSATRRYGSKNLKRLVGAVNEKELNRDALKDLATDAMYRAYDAIHILNVQNKTKTTERIVGQDMIDLQTLMHTPQYQLQIGDMSNVNVVNVNTKGIEALLKELVGHSQEKHYIDNKGRHVEIKGNVKRIYA